MREYIWLEGRVIAVIEGGELYHVRTDHIGRPVFATNDLGVKVWEVSYLPFGGVRQVLSGAPIDLRFPGQWFQSESGLHQNWMRDYDPTTGRYMQADPLGLINGASVYAYALSSPMVHTDPTGEIVPAVIAAGILISWAIDAAVQTVENCGDVTAYDWRRGANAYLLGAIPGGLSNVGRFANPLLKRYGIGKVVNWRNSTRLNAFFEDSHWFARSATKNWTSPVSRWFSRSPLNSSHVTWRFHARTDPGAFRFLSQQNKRRLGSLFHQARRGNYSDGGFQTALRTPVWLWGGAATGLSSGAISE
ncbi:RHS repeat-associated core domain-containing protein [Jannaschia pohangensis]|uniref:RHS repeat-associated core domain-containing protein n=1 Tax=Jannaschia pohangensis TaxID=390807 RepID=A0A1I3K0E9_9RHOB|nr:RHS repeat-associated core domain-containing protein [Jannaschia pohangensis]SFI65780.1 RHS repeat-associated core domain-containing protein [Jannaschia pohangensis]